jgi:fatty-acyl-CoA synthase
MPHDYETLLSQGIVAMPDVAVSESDPYSFCFTTGTSGRPKAVIYRHRDLILSIWQVVHHMALHDTPAQLGMNEVIMPLIPFFHIHGWGVPLIAPYIGSSIVMAGKLTPQEHLQLIKRHAVTWCNMVPTQLYRLLGAMSAPWPDPLKVLTGGSAVTAGLANKARQMNVLLSVIYGGSDQLASAISAIPPRLGISSTERTAIITSRVLPLPMVEMTIRDSEGRTIAPDGLSTGEIWVKSPWLPRGYVKDPQASYSAYHDGYFVSGDLGIEFPDGTFAIVDRLNDAVKSGGEWIPTSYLETVISEIEGVDQVAVLSSPDPKWGERPVAVIQTRLALEPETIITYLLAQVEAGRLAKFWIPDRIFYVHDMPLTSTGKIHKRNLLAKLEQMPEYPHQS